MILEDGWDLGLTQRFQALREEVGWKPEEQFYGYGGHLVAVTAPGTLTRDRVAARVGSGCGQPTDVPDVDLLIRTGGEQRLSDFLLWESAYAELCFMTVMWPDFGAADLARAMEEFKQRDRRFGGVVAT